jgi:hypothetical protein
VPDLAVGSIRTMKYSQAPPPAQALRGVRVVRTKRCVPAVYSWFKNNPFSCGLRFPSPKAFLKALSKTVVHTKLRGLQFYAV